MTDFENEIEGNKNGNETAEATVRWQFSMRQRPSGCPTAEEQPTHETCTVEVLQVPYTYQKNEKHPVWALLIQE